MHTQGMMKIMMSTSQTAKLHVILNLSKVVKKSVELCGRTTPRRKLELLIQKNKVLCIRSREGNFLYM